MDKDRINRLTQMAIEYLHHNGINDSYIQVKTDAINGPYKKYIIIHSTAWVENDETIGISDDVICAIIFGTKSELKVWPYLCVDRDKLVFIAAYDDVVHKKETDKAINKTKIIKWGCDTYDFNYGGAVTINLGKQLKKNESIEQALGKIIAEIKPLFETSVKIRSETQKEINLQKFKKAVEDI